MEIVDNISKILGAAAIAVICWGVVTGLIEFVKLEIGRQRGANTCHQRELLRHHLGSYLLLGLEILIAADIVHTLIKPTLEEVAVLGAIVVIRTILSFFLNREITGHTCPKE
jgi:uncharacterized membrane protein